MEGSMDYIRLANTEDFEQTKIKSYKIMGKNIAIIQRKNGTFYAIEASCKHQGADLTTGEIKNNIATCPRHQWQYDLETGECLNHESLPLRKHDLRIEEGQLLVSLFPVEEE
jgi:nitrite reductase/ring-hydroxylating ferredoxin subunit